MQEDQIAEVLKALAHPSRIRILEVLEKGPKCVKELEKLVMIKQSNLSQHLRILKDRGILECKREGMEVCYQIRDRRILNVIKCVEKFFTSGG